MFSMIVVLAWVTLCITEGMCGDIVCFTDTLSAAAVQVYLQLLSICITAHGALRWL